MGGAGRLRTTHDAAQAYAPLALDASDPLRTSVNPRVPAHRQIWTLELGAKLGRRFKCSGLVAGVPRQTWRACMAWIARSAAGSTSVRLRYLSPDPLHPVSSVPVPHTAGSPCVP